MTQTVFASYINGDGYMPVDMMQRDADWVVPGVLASADLLVTAPGGMAVQVSGSAQGSVGGNAWLPGGVRFYNSAPATLAIAANSSGNPRIDLVVAGIDTSVGSPYNPTVIVITGTPAVSPTVPAPINTLTPYIPLAQVAVANGTSSIVAGNITDVRTRAGMYTPNGMVLSAVDPGTGGANVYIANPYPAFTALADMTPIAVKIATTSTGASTLNVSGLGAKAILDSFGNAITAGGLVAGIIYTFRYNATTSSFIVQGKGGGGTAVASQVLTGSTFSNNSGANIPGTMPNNGATSFPPQAYAQLIPIGYYNGLGQVPSVTGTATTANVLTGYSFCSGTGVGQSGTMVNQAAKSYTPSTSVQTITAGYYNGSGTIAAATLATGTAAAAQVLTGYTFSNASSSGISGTMPNNEQVTATSTGLNAPGTLYSKPPMGYYSGDSNCWLETYDANFTAANISSTSEVFGISGSYYSPHGTQTFTGNGTFTVPAGVNQVIAYVVGGGGGGGWGTTYGAFGGNAGTEALVVIPVSPGHVQTVTIGTGGACATTKTHNGTAGTASSITGNGVTVSCPGGAGGSDAVLSSYPPAASGATISGATAVLTSTSYSNGLGYNSNACGQLATILSTVVGGVSGGNCLAGVGGGGVTSSGSVGLGGGYGWGSGGGANAAEGPFSGGGGNGEVIFIW